jgi:phage terminase large subunit
MPRGAALELMSFKGREVLLSGPANTGKSRGCLEKLNTIAMQKPIRGAIVRKVRAALTQAAMATFEEKVLPEPSGVHFHDGDQEYRYPNGAKVIVAGLDDPRKILSTDFDIIYVQEATECTEVDWGILLSRLRNGVLSYQQLMADCNPSSPSHWLKQRCERGQTVLMESRHDDNPTVTPEYLEALDSLPGYLYQRLRLGLWVAAEGMYFTEWNPEKHLIYDDIAEDIPSTWPRWVSVDYGFAVPFCALWHARDPETHNIITYRELYQAGIRDEQQADLIIEKTGDEWLRQVVLDPSMFNARTEQRRPSIAQVYGDRGVAEITSDGIWAGQNNRKQGWAIMRRALAWDEKHPPRWSIVKSACPNLVRELPALVRDPFDPEDVADKIGSQKIDDHAADAARYGLCAEAIPAAATGSRPASIVIGPR